MKHIKFLKIGALIFFIFLMVFTFLTCSRSIEKSMKGITETTARKAKASKKIIKPPTYKEIVIFSGQVVSTLGKAIDSAEVRVNGKSVKTDCKGYFKISVKPSKRFVMNIRRKGFGLVSKIYTIGIQDGFWTMTEATTQFLDPTENIFIQDIRTPDICNGTLSSQIDWSRYPNRHVPRYIDSEGRISGEVTDEVKKAIEFAENCDTCNPGITINIPANSLVDSNGNIPPGNVLASVSTVDIYDSDSMPGDYTVRADSRSGYMVTYGAGGVNITAKEKPYKLKKGAYAILTIPINSAQLKLGGKLEPEIPLLLYNERAGVWEPIGKAELNSKDNAYIAKIYHLSEFNMDIIKTDQACVRIDSSGIDSDYELEVIVPIDADVVIRTKEVDNTPEKHHVIYNLPSNTDITLRAFKRVGSTIIPITDTITINTGNPQNPSTPNSPDGPPYTACNADVVLTENYLAPILDGPVSSTGTYNLTWDYEWSGMLAATSDGYQLEESLTSSTTGFSLIYETANTSTADRRIHVVYSLTRTPGNYWYRVRAQNNGIPTPYSNVIQVVVTNQEARQLMITNNVGSQRLTQVVQVKIIPIGDMYTTADLLTPDSQNCWNLPGEDIEQNDSRTFDVTVGDDYLVFIGIGIWETDLVTGLCPLSSPWVKIRFFTDINFYIHYVWIEMQVSDHQGGLWEWSISGSYTSGNLVLTPAGSGSWPFQITDNDPFSW